MNLGLLFLESISTGVITSDEMNWVTSNQSDFSRVEEATALKLGRLLDRGLIQIGCRGLQQLSNYSTTKNRTKLFKFWIQR